MFTPTDKKPYDGEKLKSLLKINQRNCPFVKHIDNYTVKYMGKGLMHTDVASIQSLFPITKDDILFYFEVKILDYGTRGDISIGLADGNFPSNKHPGYTKNSYGYKAEGKTYTNKLASMQTFPKYNTEDIVGCGLNFLKKEIFFTHNGTFLGSPFKNIEIIDFYPTIGLHSQHESIKFNFDLKFKIEELRQEEILLARSEILTLSINSYDVHQIVQSYLYYHGYYKTLDCFEKITELPKENTQIIAITEIPQKDSIKIANGHNGIMLEEESKIDEEIIEESKETNEKITLENSLKVPLEIRTQQKDRDFVRDLVHEGKIEDAFDFLKTNYPKIIDEKLLILAINGQLFLEFIRKGDINKAIEIAQKAFPNYEEEVLDFIDQNGKLVELKVEDIMGIICYEKPENCAIGYLLNENQREILSEKINSAIFGSLNFNKKSILELLLSQCICLQEKNNEMNCYLGNLFDYSS